MAAAAGGQVRRFALDTVRHTCRRVTKATLGECLRLDGAALDALVRPARLRIGLGQPYPGCAGAPCPAPARARRRGAASVRRGRARFWLL